MSVAPARHREATAVLGMSLFMASWAMLFAALFFAYGFTRARALAWPPADLPRLPLALPGLATLAIGAASAALVRARRPAAGTRPLRSVLVAIGGSAVFLAVQIAVAASLYAGGLRPDGGPYASVFYGLTTFHALHVAVGIGGLVSLLPALRRAEAHGWPAPIALRLWALYTHMVTVLWLLLYLGVYCL